MPRGPRVERQASDGQARERLTQVSHKLAEQMYSKAQPQSASGAGPSGGGNSATGGQPSQDEGVIDAEYTDVEEKKSA
jgi:molecular chaperone DnaK